MSALRQLFADLKVQANLIPKVKTVGMWNNQLDWFLAGKLQMFAVPAVFFAYESATIMQLGEGRQLYEPLIITAHILHWQIDAGDGTFEQNLDVFDFAEDVFKTLQKFQPGLTDPNALAGSFIRIAETQDHSHAGVYHFIQTYKTNLVDDALVEPTGNGQLLNTTTTGEIDQTTQDSVDPNEPYIYSFS